MQDVASNITGIDRIRSSDMRKRCDIAVIPLELRENYLTVR